MASIIAALITTEEGPDDSFSSPSRRVSLAKICATSNTNDIKTKKPISYAESDDEEDDVPFRPMSTNTNARAAKRRKLNRLDDSDSDQGYAPEQMEQDDEGQYLAMTW